MGAEDLVQRVLQGQTRAVARVISLIENEGADGERCTELLFPKSGRAYVLGVTGPPGAGKSTLVDQLAGTLSADGARVAVVAVDPSSPFTGGALLGDRIRMARSAALPGVFIRSMASRGALGGIAPTTAEAIFALDAAGFDYVVVETVGVGQGEVEIVRVADTVIVVSVPGMGDSVQVFKAGIMEIADLFVINKADLPGADRLQKEITTLQSLNPAGTPRADVVRTVATAGEGTADLKTAIAHHRERAHASGDRDLRRARFLRQTVERLVAEESIRAAFSKAAADGRLDRELEALTSRRVAPRIIARRLMRG